MRIATSIPSCASTSEAFAQSIVAQQVVTLDDVAGADLHAAISEGVLGCTRDTSLFHKCYARYALNRASEMRQCKLSLYHYLPGWPTGKTTVSTTSATGVNYFKKGDDPPLKEDSEYPEWLWDIAEPPPTLFSLQRQMGSSEISDENLSEVCIWMHASAKHARITSCLQAAVDLLCLMCTGEAGSQAGEYQGYQGQELHQSQEVARMYCTGTQSEQSMEP